MIKRFVAIFFVVCFLAATPHFAGAQNAFDVAALAQECMDLLKKDLRKNVGKGLIKSRAARDKFAESMVLLMLQLPPEEKLRGLRECINPPASNLE